MYLAELKIKNFRQFGNPESGIVLTFNPGVTALVGENDSGKTAVVDAIRYVLLTRDTDYIRVQPSDFHISPDGVQETQITLRCKLADLSDAEKGALAEYLTYEGEQTIVYINWIAVRLADAPGSRRWVDVNVRTGASGEGPSLEQSARQLLAAAYLRPLRDAEREMSPGRQSRLSQILQNFPAIKDGAAFEAATPPSTPDHVRALSLVGLADYLRYLINAHATVQGAQSIINRDYLSELALSGEVLHGSISFADGGTEAARLRNILERLEVELLEGPAGVPRGAYGLGSNNLLFMACELLLLGREPDGLPLLIIEEPEAHLHPQRQLRLMEFLEAAVEEADGRRKVQVIVTTHSPNLSSKIRLSNLVLLHKQRAFSLAEGSTKLSSGDYRFLERFLDVTKANMFFARGVIIVEGDAEAILIPALAKMLGRDLTQHGVSIVNVGGTGLKRYSRILQRADAALGVMGIPVARIVDMDVMPDCAPTILGLVADENDPKWTSSRRRWYAMRDLGPDEASRQIAWDSWRDGLCDGDDDFVKTFVSGHWTLEYDLAFAGLAREVFVAAYLAKNDEVLHTGRNDRANIEADAVLRFQQIAEQAGADPAVLCSIIYDEFYRGRASKAITAQYFVELVKTRFQSGDLVPATMLAILPPYIVSAIEHVTPLHKVAALVPSPEVEVPPPLVSDEDWVSDRSHH